MTLHDQDQRSRGKGIPRWAMWVITAAPVVVLLAGLAMTVDAYRFAASAKHATGIVIEAGRYSDRKERVFYRPTVRYQRDDGEELDGKINISSNLLTYRLGDQVEILYSDAEPGVVRLDTFFSLYGFAPSLAGFGAIFLVIIAWFRREVARGDIVLKPAPPASSQTQIHMTQIHKTQRASISKIRRYVPEWVWWVLITIFSISTLLGFWVVLDAVLFFADAQKARGEVVQVERYQGHPDNAAYLATIRYRRDDGMMVQGRTNIPMSTYNFKIGEQVDIYYSRSRPEEVRIDDFVTIYFPSLFFILFGVLFIVLVLWAREKTRYSVAPDWEDNASVFNVAAEEAKLKSHGLGGKPLATEPPARSHRPKPQDPPTVRRRR